MINRSKKHLPNLDALRGIAAIIIVIYHFDIFHGGFMKFHPSNAWLAVDLFFLLSGYVISRAYGESLQSGKMLFSRFIAVRFVRLYPTYIFSVILSLFIMILIQFSPSPICIVNIKQIIYASFSALFFLPSLSKYLSGWNMNVVWWSLSYELLINVILSFFWIHKKTKLITCILAVTWFFLLFLAFYSKTLGGGTDLNYKSIIFALTRSAYGIFLGFLLYQHQDRSVLKKISINPTLSFLLILFFLLFSGKGYYCSVQAILAVTIIFPICVLSLARADVSNPALSKVLFWLGSISYPLYVLHVPIINLTISYIPYWISQFKPWGGIMLIMVVLTIADLINRLVDIPGRKFLSLKIFRSA